MQMITVRFFWEKDVAGWEKLESTGRIGPTQAKHLHNWRLLKQWNPDMVAMSFSHSSQYAVWKRREKGNE